MMFRIVVTECPNVAEKQARFSEYLVESTSVSAATAKAVRQCSFVPEGCDFTVAVYRAQRGLLHTSETEEAVEAEEDE